MTLAYPYCCAVEHLCDFARGDSRGTVRACGAAGRPEDALELLDVMRDEPEGGVRPDTFCFNVCISAVGKAGLHEKALSLLREMRSEGVKPDVFRYDSTLFHLQQQRQQWWW